jgi:ubiquitin
MRSVRFQFATVCAVNAYYLLPMRSVRIQFVNICFECVKLNQVKTYGKSEKSKKKLTQRQKSLAAYTAHTLELIKKDLAQMADKSQESKGSKISHLSTF